MVKNKSDKTKLSNWEDGDVFALKIESEKYPKYNNRYIIFIHCIIPKKDWEMSRTTNTFRAKITKDNKLPTSKEEIENLEYIKTSWDKYLFEKTRRKNETKKLKPDQFHLIYKYLFVIKSLKYKLPENIIYIGNFDITPPTNEYIPYSQHHSILYSFWNEKYSKIVEKLLMYYEMLNLKKGEIFTEKKQKNFYKDEQEEILQWKEIEKRMKKIDKLYKKGRLEISNEKKPTKNSITYVGEDQKKQKNK